MLHTWLYNVYATDLGLHGSSSNVAKRVCLATATTADSQRTLLVPDPQVGMHASPHATTTTIIDLAAVLPWVRQPRDLFRHWVRLEAYAIMPIAVKVLDTHVFLCAPEDDVPGVPPNAAGMRVVTFDRRGRESH
jgi:hypothetical protein